MSTQTKSAFMVLAINTLAMFGIDYEPSMVYRLTSKYDTQDIPLAANTAVNFLNTDTSSRTAHAQKEFGCNLREPGKIDEKETFVTLGCGIQLLGMNGGNAARANDLAMYRDWGFLKELEVDDRSVVRYRELASMGMNRGLTVELLGAGAAADFDMVTTGQPGIPKGPIEGMELQPFERQILTPGTSVVAPCAVNSPDGDMSAAIKARFHLIGVSIRPKAG